VNGPGFGLCRGRNDPASVRSTTSAKGGGERGGEKKGDRKESREKRFGGKKEKEEEIAPNAFM
jgi:hypothetical protein